jgi:SPP1 family predicted phage head-tail adaptor
MSKPFDRPITIQKLDELTEDWVDVFNVHCRINKTKSDNEYLNAGATQNKKNLTFEVRYFKALEVIDFNKQIYRIMYLNTPFNIVDYDDFMLEHKTVKLMGVSY